MTHHQRAKTLDRLKKPGESDPCGENEQTLKTREFIDELQKHTDIPVKYLDERFTTLSAERVLIQGNVRRENRKKVIDKVAATIILQNYLDSKN